MCKYCEKEEYYLHSEYNSFHDHYRRTYFNFKNAELICNEYSYDAGGKSGDIRKRDSKTEVLKIKFCPMCGRKLGESID